MAFPRQHVPGGDLRSFSFACLSSIPPSSCLECRRAGRHSSSHLESMETRIIVIRRQGSKLGA